MHRWSDPISEILKFRRICTYNSLQMHLGREIFDRLGHMKVIARKVFDDFENHVNDQPADWY